MSRQQHEVQRRFGVFDDSDFSNAEFLEGPNPEPLLRRPREYGRGIGEQPRAR